MINRKKKKVIINSVLVSLLVSICLLLTGCVTEEQTEGNLELIGYDHDESYITGNFSSEIMFYVSNTGNQTIESSTLNIQINNQNGTVIYDEKLQISESIDVGENKTVSTTVVYNKNNTELNLNLNVTWDDKVNSYSETLFLEDISSDVELINISHEEQLISEDLFTSTVTFNLTNTGQEPAHNVILDVKAADQDNNTEYNNETTISDSLGHLENTTEEIMIDYNLIDDYLLVDITIIWDEGKREYEELINLEIIE
ncbi:MAG TPA: hypothetical protein VKP59_07280 [Candidatus Thermoplasmatota archaeon]|nr:hypothetical protein [Candidatus Thermoplasmatota archaeon]